MSQARVGRGAERAGQHRGGGAGHGRAPRAAHAPAGAVRAAGAGRRARHGPLARARAQGVRQRRQPGRAHTRHRGESVSLQLPSFTETIVFLYLLIKRYGCLYSQTTRYSTV